MKIPITDRRVTIHGATLIHQGLIDINLRKIRRCLVLNLFGEHVGERASQKKYWCSVIFPEIPVESLRGKVALDTALILQCYGKTGMMSEDMVLDLMLQELLVSITFDFTHSRKRCVVFIKGIEDDISMDIQEQGGHLRSMFEVS